MRPNQGTKEHFAKRKKKQNTTRKLKGKEKQEWNLQLYYDRFGIGVDFVLFWKNLRKCFMIVQLCSAYVYAVLPCGHLFHWPMVMEISYCFPKRNTLHKRCTESDNCDLKSEISKMDTWFMNLLPMWNRSLHIKRKCVNLKRPKRDDADNLLSYIHVYTNALRCENYLYSSFVSRFFFLLLSNMNHAWWYAQCVAIVILYIMSTAYVVFGLFVWNKNLSS